AVKAVIQAEGGRLEDVEKQTQDGKTVYEADVIKDGTEIELRIAEDGTVLSRKVETDDEDEDEDDEGDDEDEDEDDDDGKKGEKAAAAAVKAKTAAAVDTAADKARIGLLKAIELAAQAVPDGRVVRLELSGGSYDVVVATKDKLQALEIDARTGKAGGITEAQMDADEFKDAASANKALTAAKITLAEAVKRVEKKARGKAAEAEIKVVAGKPRYEVKVVKADGSSEELAVDALKGELLAQRKPAADNGRPFRDSFPVDKANLVPTGRNPYFILEPGFRCHYAGGGETLVITVLDETRKVDGVLTRVVEEREEKNGKLAEVSRNFFAIDKNTLDVYYFGEEVDIYKNGKVVAHEGAWLSGEKGARFGLMMPGKPRVGDRFYQEYAPKQAMDRAEIVSLDASQKTPAGDFEKKCLYVKESSPLESGTSEKWYVAGIGLVRDEELLLTKVEDPKAGK
ncbi:MAG: hypothetical protein HRF43_01395, partial [Phycisphaerae bacterium]